MIATPPRLIDRHVGPNGVAEVRYAAAHESAHVVISRVFGVRGVNAYLYEDDATGRVGGYATTAPYAALRSIWQRRGKFRSRDTAIRAAIIIALAGGEAEGALYGWKGGDGGDLKDI